MHTSHVVAHSGFPPPRVPAPPRPPHGMNSAYQIKEIMLSSYALGVLFLVIVSLLWTACSMVVQHLYNDMLFDSPFLIVYIGTSLFLVFLPSRLGYERWGHRCLM